MPPRITPTERQKRLGHEVRKLRSAAGLTSSAAAELLGVDRSKISNIENGVRTISPDRLKVLAEHGGWNRPDFLAGLSDLALPQPSGWWSRYRDALPSPLVDIAELEHHSISMRTAHALHVPGLLQTTEHALAVFRFVTPRLTEQESALRLTFRLERQKIIMGNDPTPYDALIHEAALHMRFGGKDVWKGQLQQLAELALRSNITIRVIPFEAGGIPGAGQTVNYLKTSVPELDTVEVDSAHGPEFLRDADQLEKYRQLLDLMEELTLSPEHSLDFIHNLLKTS